ncbi:TPA: tail fiber assembly protein, partial [Escherichia coli]|nr:tail fiber assembly protein [Escherichia coli]EHX8118036.1 tail fiber assembly protein [Escherichia coli]EII1508083.1 tail fiber assembly protein [Escherichia coli]EII2854154.1 tail fiber assembly protein [Escherichia coli]EIM4594098.1 tail fiber assembly protein [Escherichia coli]
VVWRFRGPVYYCTGPSQRQYFVMFAWCAPLQDAADLEIVIEEETSLREAWKKYRVLLNRVDTSAAPDIEWPTSPAE